MWEAFTFSYTYPGGVRTLKIIVADGTPAELKELLGDRIVEAFARSQPAADGDFEEIDDILTEEADEDAPPAPRAVKVKKLTKEFNDITDRATRAVEQIALNAPRVSFDRVVELGGFKNTKEMGGGLSSLGHSAPLLQRMIYRDWSRREYVIDAEDAKAILEALESHRARM